MSTACPRRPPGAEKRRLAMLYCELRQREVEYVCLSRDTTESDLKQRREIVAGGTVLYTDQPPVRAALNGCVLVLDGLERCERNVLPTLNNLLENREMTLEDGRMLLAADRYDELRAKHSADELRALRLERVSPDFIVVALGLPIPAFPGKPPPLCAARGHPSARERAAPRACPLRRGRSGPGAPRRSRPSRAQAARWTPLCALASRRGASTWQARTPWEACSSARVCVARR